MYIMTASISKIVLITGNNQGIGFEIARSLSSKAGYHVLLGSRDAQRGINAAKQLQEKGLHVEPITIEYVRPFVSVPPRYCHNRKISRRCRICCTLELYCLRYAAVLR
jgi:hypothetical protein